MKKLIVGNWKMNGSLASNAGLLSALRKEEAGISCDWAVCVPYPYLAQCVSELNGSTIAYGSQNVSDKESGAFTGDVSAAMLSDFGCRYAIVGHSERRAYCMETDGLVADKAKAALKHGITPIVCVGETLPEREAGRTLETVGLQLECVLKVLSADEVDKIVVAYEPVWAIGTGKTPTVREAALVHAHLRAVIGRYSADAAGKVRILYGGSMKPSNAEEFLKTPGIDGGLIGGASLVAADFLSIARTASATK